MIYPSIGQDGSQKHVKQCLWPSFKNPFYLKSALPARMVDGVVLPVLPGQDQLGNGHESVSLLQQRLDNGRQRLRRMKGRIVEQYNRSWLRLFRHPPGDLLCGDILPVQAVHRPLHRFHPQPPHGGDHVVVVLAVGAAEQGGTYSRDRLDLIVAGVQVRGDLLHAQPAEMCVIVGVAHDLMPRIMQCPNGFRIFIRPLPHHKEGGRYLIPIQNVDDLLGIFVAPG